MKLRIPVELRYRYPLRQSNCVQLSDSRVYTASIDGTVAVRDFEGRDSQGKANRRAVPFPPCTQ